MKSISTFQAVLLGSLGVIAFLAILIFAGVIPTPWHKSGTTGGTVVLWGPISEEVIHDAINSFQEQHKGDFALNYVYKDPSTFENSLVEALAAGQGPDLVILPHAALVKRQANIIPISFDDYSQAQFNTDFIRESSLYLTNSGLLALPLYLDPLVLYSNTDLLSAARLVAPPKTWNEMDSAVKALTQADQNKNLTLSAIALGKANNIQNAKDIMSLLIMQAGNPIVTLNNNNQLNVVLSNSDSSGTSAAAKALDYFNHFSNSANSLYSWNGAQPEAREALLRSRLAMYLGYASEFSVIKRQNPQLDLEADVVPQLSKTSAVTVGKLYGVSLVRGAKNPLAAISAATLLSGIDFSKALTEGIGLPPARKDLLGSFPADPTLSAFYQSAIFSHGWLDPDPAASQTIFQKMIENSQSGVASTAESVQQAQSQLQAILSKS